MRTVVAFPSGDTFEVLRNQTLDNEFDSRTSCELCCFNFAGFGCFNPNVDECYQSPYTYYVPLDAPTFGEGLLNLMSALNTPRNARKEAAVI